MPEQMFNADQRDYMRYLASLPPEAKCGCGWYDRGDCTNCKPENGGMVVCGATHPKNERVTCFAKQGHSYSHMGSSVYGHDTVRWDDA